MTEQIWIASLTAHQLLEWLKPPRTEAPFAILERVDAIDFPGPSEAIAPDQWSHGRIFGQAYELRWERRGDVYRARLIGEQDPGAPFGPWPALANTETFETGSYLWGKDELRIGRQLEYRAAPKGNGRLRLARREFRCRSDASLVSERLVGMTWEGEP
ncbi:MAG: hypothetical protein HYY65_01095 [Candidatus Tectomicrobia bacterium]|uniref:Uncharacterized protein n=1 Tax=Tectimicrobiota bacterium TaxID=2528274 RepID=A0A932GM50_UNCTE|nr:hypothetical protein [Candidatus Tectomicrobia bacterium]